MIKKNYFIFCLILILVLPFSSCFLDVGECDPKEMKIAFQSPEAQYRKEVLANIANYTKLRDFIIGNIDTLFLYHAKNRFIEYEMGTRDSIKYPRDHFAFYDYGKGNIIKDQIPPYLYPQLKKIYTAFNKNNFYAVWIYRDSSVTISITNPSEYNFSKDIGINHSLEWSNHKVVFGKDSTSLSRDTTLSNGWKYKVFIDCYQGI